MFVASGASLEKLTLAPNMSAKWPRILVASTLNFHKEYNVAVCGPSGFMEGLQGQLLEASATVSTKATCEDSSG